MSTIWALISNPEALLSIHKKHKSAHVFSIGQGFALIPFTEEFYDEVSIPPDQIELRPDPFPDLNMSPSANMADVAAEASHIYPVAFIFADYFGGLGSQSSLVWADGQVILGPLELGMRNGVKPPPRGNYEAPINKALRMIGVECESGEDDEFRSVHIDREPEDWIWRDTDKRLDKD